MSTVKSVIHRGTILSIIGAVVWAIWTRLQDHDAKDRAPTTTLPLDRQDSTTGNTGSGETAGTSDTFSGDDAGSDEPSSGKTPVADEAPKSGASAPAWVSPKEDGSMPETHPVKATERSGIYHVPGGSFYARTKAARCYATAAAAEADGYRPAKS